MAEYNPHGHLMYQPQSSNVSYDEPAGTEPDWFENKSQTSEAAKSQQDGGEDAVNDDDDDEDFCLGPPERPLERLCPDYLASANVEEFFPSYRPNTTLHFYSLFKPAHRPPRYWAKKQKKPKRTAVQFSPGHDDDAAGSVCQKNLADVAVKAETDEELLMRCSETDFVKMREEKIRKGLLCDISSPEMLALFGSGDNSADDATSQIAPWRYGPAKLWYDRIGVAPDARTVNYGFRAESLANKAARNTEKKPDALFQVPEDAFNMVSHYRWEDDIIWTPEQAKEIEQSYETDKSRLARAGWVPHGDVRTMAQFYSKYKDALPGINTAALLDILAPKGPDGASSSGQTAAKSRLIYPIFPPESAEMVSGNWEDKIIWDAEHMDRLPQPELVLPAPGDDLANLHLPESGESGGEVDDEDPGALPGSPVKGQNRQARKRSRLLLKSARGLGSGFDDLDPEASSNPLSCAKNIFNLSNDEFYEGLSAASKVLGGRSIAMGVLQHATPAAELRPIFFPTCLSLTKLRQYHRPMLKRYIQQQQQQNSENAAGSNKPMTVVSLTHRIKEQAELREAERQRSGGGHVFFMRHVSDLTGRDGDVCLVEYSEQYPPLISQTGMSSKIINYYKRKPERERDLPECKYGQLAAATSGLFLGNIQPGQLVQSLCNNMFRAPLYSHHMAPNDFLLIRTRRKVFIRRVEDVFLAGQQVPIIEVPPPNSKSAFNFAKDFLLYHIYRMFLRSNEDPPRVRMEDVKKAFPQHTEATIRKRLKSIADFKRAGGSDACYWILRPETRLPSEEELHNMVSPEQFCANFSTLAGEVRLKDAGYGDRAFLAIDEDNADDLQSKMEDEVKAAPWNTTGALVSAMKGKCVLEVHGVADPTGCGQGFSYVRLPSKPPKPGEPGAPGPGTQGAPQTGPGSATLASPLPGSAEGAQAAANKRSVIGTDSDLRKLHVKDARTILRNFGVPEAEIKKLTRWEMIDVIRTMSTEQARAGIDTSFSSKFARSGRFSVHEYHRNFRRECQKVFDLQNRVLALTDPLSSEESGGGSGTEDEGGKQSKKEVEQIGRSVETILRGRGINISSGAGPSKTAAAPTTKNEGNNNKEKQRILQITRTFRTADGQTYDRVEIVRRPALVDAYVRIRSAPGGDEVVRDLASVFLGDKNKKGVGGGKDGDKPAPAKQRGRPPKIRPEGEAPPVKGKRGRKRRIVENIRENLLGGGGAAKPGLLSDDGSQSAGEPMVGADGNPLPRIRIKPMPNMKFRCSACGSAGHVRSNRNCPLFNQNKSESCAGAGDGNEANEAAASGAPGGETLIKVEETKLRVDRKFFDHYLEKIKRKSKLTGRPKKWSKLATVTASKTAAASGAGGAGAGASGWRTPTKAEEKEEEVEQRNQELEEQGNETGNDSQVELEEGEIATSTNAGDSSGNIRFKFKFGESGSGKKSRQSSGSGSRRGSGVLASCSDQPATTTVSTAPNEYARPHRPLHRRIVDPLLALNTVFEKIVNPLRTNPTFEAFSLPVDTKSVPDYPNIIERPMDLATMRTKCVNKAYGSRSDILEDAFLIVTNSRLYNGDLHPLTAIAQQLSEAIIGEVAQRDAELVPLEKAANPLIEDDFRAFSFILQGVIEEMKRVEGSWPFHDPVNRKKIKDYYEVVKTPMDLNTLSKKLQAGYYRRVSEFLCDMSLLQSNSVLYNGPDHAVTAVANRMMEVATEQLHRFSERLAECEANIPLPSGFSDLGDKGSRVGFLGADDADSVATETTFSEFCSASMTAGSALAAFVGHQQQTTGGASSSVFVGEAVMLENPQQQQPEGDLLYERPPDSAASWNATANVGLEDDLNISTSSSSPASEAEDGEINE